MIESAAMGGKYECFECIWSSVEMLVNETEFKNC